MGKAIALSILLCACLSVAAAANGDKAKARRFGDLVPQAAEAAVADGGLEPCAGYSPALKASCEAAAKAEFEHNVWALEYRQRAYEAHHRYTMWVFILVCALVVLGMYLSLRQFNLDERRKLALIDTLQARLNRLLAKQGKESEHATDDAVALEGDSSSSQLEISASGVKVSSPVLGVIILVVSMGFFYLYLKTVYPIQETAAEPSTVQPAAPAQQK